MKTRLPRHAVPAGMLLLTLPLLSAGWAFGQLRVVNYNVLDKPFNATHVNQIDTIMRAIAGTERNGIAKRPDVVSLQESGNFLADQMAQALNTTFGVSSYQSFGTGDGFDRPAMVYDSSTVALRDTESNSIGVRPALRGEFRPIGYGADADFHVYSVHLKASDGQTNQTIRLNEVNNLRFFADQLGADANVVFAGDFNFGSSFEPAFDAMLAAGDSQAFDPIEVTNWGGLSGAPHHTQSTRTTNLPDGGVPGGLDDRFDFQFATAELMDGKGLSYIGPTAAGGGSLVHSYQAFGNDGTSFNQAINANPNNRSQPQAVLDALHAFSDHLPVVADYQLPARMAVEVADPPARVLRGSATTVGVTVRNSADVLAEAGADELTYELLALGDVSGSTTGSDAALGAGSVHDLPMDTTTAGAKAGFIQVQATSDATPGLPIQESINVDVLHHATGSFASDAEMATTSIDFGPVTEGAAPVTQTFDLFNRVGEAGAAFTSAMFTGSPVAVSGDTDQLMLLETLTEVAAGESTTLTAAFDPAAAGNRTAVWHLPVRDEDLPGAMTELLEITLTGSVTPPFIRGDLDGNGVVDGLDIDPFVQALTDENAFDAAADMDGNDVVDGLDIDPFVQALTSSDNVAGLAVPEPGSLALLGLGGLALLRSRPGQARA